VRDENTQLNHALASVATSGKEDDYFANWNERKVLRWLGHRFQSIAEKEEESRQEKEVEVPSQSETDQEKSGQEEAGQEEASQEEAGEEEKGSQEKKVARLTHDAVFPAISLPTTAR